jgi:hypothetical protein
MIRDSRPKGSPDLDRLRFAKHRKNQIPRTLFCAKSAVMATAFWRPTTSLA